MFYLAGISISFFLSLLLIGKKNKTQAHKILAAWLCVLCLHLVLYYFSFSTNNKNFPLLFGLHFPMPLLHGPFLYLYAAALTKNLAANKKLDLLHFIPAIIFYLAFIPFYLLSFDEKISIVNNGGAGYQPIYSISIISIIVSGIIYVILTSILLHHHRRRVLNQFSYTEKITLRWLQYLTYGIGLIWVFIIFSHDEIIYIVAVLFILFVGYFGIKQVGIFTQDNNKEIPRLQNQVSDNNDDVNNSSEKSGEADSSKKYSKSGLTSDSASQLHIKLVEVMNTEKLFKESDLTLSQLANRLHTHPNYLSQVINDKENKNFFDYINTLRTQEFIAVISDINNQKYTLLSLAYECGFNSKSSFNKYFRKTTGQSPSEYLKGIKGESHS